MPETLRLHIRKEALKFSAAHMTVFSDGTKERLHGHNYTTELTLEFHDLPESQLTSFATFKSVMKSICEPWDEKVLLAGKSPHLKILRDAGGEIEFTLCGKRYVLPRDEVEILPIDNVVTETLAREFSRRFIAKLKPEELGRLTKIELKVEETAGQGATCVWRPKVKIG